MNNTTKYLVSFWQNELKPMLSVKNLPADIVAALAVSFVAIPLSLAVAVASNVNPSVGLVSAVLGGILGAIFGGCRLGVTGPAVAMSVLIAGTIAEYGFAGLWVVGLICGVLQLSAGLLKLGRLAKFIPLSLILAFTAGIGFLLLFNQLPHIFQVSSVGENPVWAVLSRLPQYLSKINSASFLLTLLTLVLLIIVPRFMPRALSFLFATLIPMAIVYFANLHQVLLVGPIPHHLLAPEIIDFSMIHDWKDLILAGIEVFILASLETLLSTSAVDLMGKVELHNPNQELFGQGIANLGAAFFGGVPVTGVIARSSVNVLAGAKTRRAAILQALLIMAVVYYAPFIIERMPQAVLSGILIAAAFKMMNFRQVGDLWKTDRLEVVVYLITLLAIVATDLIDGIQTGLLAAFIIVAFRMLRTKTDLKLWTNNNVLRAGLAGNLTFMSYERLAKIKNIALKQDGLRFIIFEFADLQNIDANGANHLISIAQEILDGGINVIFHGVNDDHHKVIADNCNSGIKPYAITVTEFEIKGILEANGVTHSANDVLRHGISKYLRHYAKDNQRLLTTLAKGQKPHTLLITCSDSRLNPNAIFSANIGEIFIVRNVGNVVPPYMPNNIYSEIAAIEYALAELGVRNIVICAHTECGAIKASVASGENKLGHIGLDNWLGLIKDGFHKHKPLDAADGVRINLLNQVDNLMTYPGIKDLLAAKQLTINAWIYDVHSGQILEWNDTQRDFVQLV